MRRLPLGLLVLTLGAGHGCTPEGESRVTRVVLITLDTLRFDQLDPESEAPPAMPMTRARAHRGAWFSRFYAASPVTQPTHATMFTGLHPWEHGITRNGLVVPPRLPNVVRTLQASGFSTSAVVASFPLTRRFGFAVGFDEFRTDFSQRFNQRKDEWEKEWLIPEGRFFALGEAVTNRAIEALDATRAARQFFWFHYFDAHSPYGSTRGATLSKRDVFDEVRRGGRRVGALLERVRGGYRADAAYLDAALDRLFRRLERDADRAETHVLLVADHGESLGEEGILGHGALLSEEQIRIPAFILSPKVARGTRSDVAGSIDVARTLLSLAGIAAGDTRIGGRDLTRPGDAPTRAFAMRRTFREGSGRELRLDGSNLRLDGHLYGEVDARGEIRVGNGQGVRVEDDAGASLDSTASAALAERFASFDRKLARSTQVDDVDRETRRGLEALGYVD